MPLPTRRPSSSRTAVVPSACGALAIAASLTLVACTLTLRREHDQCQTSLDCRRLAVDAICTSEGVCERLEPRTSDAGSECWQDADCATSHSLCRGGLCRALEVDGCVRLSKPPSLESGESLPVVVLAPTADFEQLRLNSTHRELGAVSTALDQLERARATGLPLPRLVAVACDEADPNAIADVVGQLEAPIVLGPMRADHLDGVLEAIGGHSVVFAPFADAPSLSLPERAFASQFLVSCRPNRSDGQLQLAAAAAFVSANLPALAADPSQLGAVLAISDLETRLGFSELWNDTALDGTGLVKVDYPSPGGEGLAKALEKSAVTPRLVVAPSDTVDWGENLVSNDAAIFAKHALRAHYLFSSKQQSVIYAATQAQLPPEARLYDRSLGLDWRRTPEQMAANAEFDAAFQAHTEEGAIAGLEYVNDCTYLAVYAALAARLRFALPRSVLSPQMLILALRAFSDGPTIAVGAEGIPGVVQALQASRAADGTVNLIGASGELDLLDLPPPDALPKPEGAIYLRPAGADAELYCLDAPHTSFCDSGVIFTASGTKSLVSTKSCPCFSIP